MSSNWGVQLRNTKGCVKIVELTTKVVGNQNKLASLNTYGWVKITTNIKSWMTYIKSSKVKDENVLMVHNIKLQYMNVEGVSDNTSIWHCLCHGSCKYHPWGYNIFILGML